METKRLNNSYNQNFVVNRSLRVTSQLLPSLSLQSIPDGKLKIGNGKVTDYVKSESQCVGVKGLSRDVQARPSLA